MPYSINFIPISTLILYLLAYLSLGLCASQLAKFKNRSQIRWFFLGFFFGLIAVIFLLCLSSLPSNDTTNNFEPQSVVSSKNNTNMSFPITSSSQDSWWYYLSTTKQSTGPLSYEELIVFLKEKLLIHSKSEIETIWLWKKGMQDWKQIKDIQEIKKALKI